MISVQFDERRRGQPVLFRHGIPGPAKPDLLPEFLPQVVALLLFDLASPAGSRESFTVIPTSPESFQVFEVIPTAGEFSLRHVCSHGTPRIHTLERRRALQLDRVPPDVDVHAARVFCPHDVARVRWDASGSGKHPYLSATFALGMVKQSTVASSA